MALEKAKTHVKKIVEKREGELTSQEYAEQMEAKKALREMYDSKDPDARKALRAAIFEFKKNRRDRIQLLKDILGRDDWLTMEQMNFLGFKEMLGKEKVIDFESNSIIMGIGVRETKVKGYQYRGRAWVSRNMKTGKPELEIKIHSVLRGSPKKYNLQLRGIKLDEKKDLYAQVKAHIDKIKAEIPEIFE